MLLCQSSLMLGYFTDLVVRTTLPLCRRPWTLSVEFAKRTFVTDPDCKNAGELQLLKHVRLMSDIVPDSIATVDGQELSSEEARRVSKRLFIGGFFLLPWLWLANLWLFWPELRSASDTAVYSYARRSALAFACSTVLLMTWIGMFSIGGQKVLGASFFDKWNLANIDPNELQT